MQPHWVSALAWPEKEAESLWCGEPKDILLVGRMDGSVGLIEVLDSSSMHRTELEHCCRKDGKSCFRTFSFQPLCSYVTQLVCS